MDSPSRSAAKRQEFTQEPAAIHAARSHGDRLSVELVKEWDALRDAVDSIRALVSAYEVGCDARPDETLNPHQALARRAQRTIIEQVEGALNGR